MEYQYFDAPLEKWTTSLGSSRLGRGNAISASPDGSLLYVTTQTGNLHVLSAFDGTERWSYNPTSLSSNTVVECQGGVAFGELDGIGVYAVFAIIDRRTDNANGNINVGAQRYVCVLIFDRSYEKERERERHFIITPA